MTPGNGDETASGSLHRDCLGDRCVRGKDDATTRLEAAPQIRTLVRASGSSDHRFAACRGTELTEVGGGKRGTADLQQPVAMPHVARSEAAHANRSCAQALQVGKPWRGSSMRNTESAGAAVSFTASSARDSLAITPPSSITTAGSSYDRVDRIVLNATRWATQLAAFPVSCGGDWTMAPKRSLHNAHLMRCSF